MAAEGSIFAEGLPAKQPRGFTLQQLLRDHSEDITQIAWSPDGRYLASAAFKELRIWETQEWRRLHSFDDTVAAWSPDGQVLVSVGFLELHLRDTNTWQLREIPVTKPVGNDDLAWSPTGELIAVVGFQKPIEVREAGTGQIRLVLDAGVLKQETNLQDSVKVAAWSPDGQTLASDCTDCTVRLWDISTGQVRFTLMGHSNTITSLAWFHDGAVLASASADRTIRVWDGGTGKPIAVLEGHTAQIVAVATSHDGRLMASKSKDGTVRLWRCDRFEMVSILEEPCDTQYWKAGLAFHPKEPMLATLGPDGKSIRVWHLDLSAVLGCAPPAEPVHYTNAKVVLVGDSGVGKSGLALALVGQPFVPTDSSHGRHVWSLETREAEIGDAIKETREILLWDLAGQPGYRVFHRQHLNEAAVALVLFDSRSEADPFAGVGFWARAVDEASREFSPVKCLVASRVDRGGPQVSQQRLDEVLARYGFDRSFEVSAKRGDGIQDLGQAIRAAIAWDEMPRVSTPRLFYDMKIFVLDEKKSGQVLQRRHELFTRYARLKAGAAATEESFSTCLGRLEVAGFVKQLTFGDLVLLQPEMLDDYGAWLAMAARQEPEGLGFISDRRARSGDFAMDADRPLKDRPEEHLLITATVEDIVGRGIALRQPTEEGEMLIFPSELRKDIADFPGAYVRAVTFFFDGPVATIYASLAVCLTHAPAYTRDRFFKSAAILRSASGEACGFVVDYPDDTNESHGRLTVFFDADASRTTKLTFLRYINRHLERMAFEGSVRRERVYYCGCGYPDPVSQTAVEWRRSHGERTVVAGCGDHLAIDDLAEESSHVDVLVEEQMELSDNERLRQQRLAVLAERERGLEFHVFLCHNSKDKPLVRQLAAVLREQGVLPWMDEEGVLAGSQFVPDLEAIIDRVPSVAIIVGPHWLGRWQQQEYYAFLQRFVEGTGTAKKRVKVIPILLPGAPNEPTLPAFLRAFQYVDFRVGFENPQTVRSLVGAILSNA